MTTDVTDNPSASRFEMTIDGELVGYLEYHEKDGTYAVPHAQVLPQHGGRGHGSELVVRSLQTMRERGGSVLPYCGFVRKVVRDHPELADLVPESERATFGV